MELPFLNVNAIQNFSVFLQEGNKIILRGEWTEK